MGTSETSHLHINESLSADNAVCDALSHNSPHDGDPNGLLEVGNFAHLLFRDAFDICSLANLMDTEAAFEYSWSQAPSPDNYCIDAVAVCFRTGILYSVYCCSTYIYAAVFVYSYVNILMYIIHQHKHIYYILQCPPGAAYSITTSL